MRSGKMDLLPSDLKIQICYYLPTTKVLEECSKCYQNPKFWYQKAQVELGRQISSKFYNLIDLPDQKKYIRTLAYYGKAVIGSQFILNPVEMFRHAIETLNRDLYQFCFGLVTSELAPKILNLMAFHIHRGVTVSDIVRIIRSTNLSVKPQDHYIEIFLILASVDQIKELANADLNLEMIEYLQIFIKLLTNRSSFIFTTVPLIVRALQLGISEDYLGTNKVIFDTAQSVFHILKNIPSVKSSRDIVWEFLAYKDDPQLFKDIYSKDPNFRDFYWLDGALGWFNSNSKLFNYIIKNMPLDNSFWDIIVRRKVYRDLAGIWILFKLAGSVGRRIIFSTIKDIKDNSETRDLFTTLEIY